MRTIQEELRLFFKERSSRSTDQTRNSEMIMYFYGLGDSAWPTLQETADRWGLSRERIRQIKKTHFLRRADKLNIPAVTEFLELLEAANYWKQSSLVDETLARCLVEDRFSIRGLLNLINDMGLHASYDIYTPDLKRVTRHSISAFTECFVMQAQLQKQVAPLFTRARKLSHRYGIAKLDYLSPADGLPEDTLALLAELIRSGATGWSIDAEGDTWYWFEDTENVLITFAQKVFAVVDECPIGELTESFSRALGRRKYQNPFATEAVIEEYLRASKHFRVDANIVRYFGPRDYRSNLPNVEADLREYLLRTEGGTTYEKLIHELTSRGHSQSNAKQMIFFSPIVRIDKRAGRGHYRYFLIGSGGTESGTETCGHPRDDRHAEYSRRLSELDSTDAPIETTRRKEQDILRQWILMGEEFLCCAICGKSYHVGALVAAHKKRREDCSPAEKRDPYIVMPLCVLGCDYLYEQQFLRIRKGEVIRGKDLAEGDEAMSYVNEVVGRRVQDRWLRGRESYFR